MKTENQIHANISDVIRSARNQGTPFYQALLELIDNSFDAGADTIKISDEEGDLKIVDNGSGFDDVVRALDYGKSDKEGMIGRYGVGLKHAAAKYSDKTVIISKGSKVVADWKAIASGIKDTVEKSDCKDTNKTEITLANFRSRYNRSIKTDIIRRVYAPSLEKKNTTIWVNGKKLKPLPYPAFTKTVDIKFEYQGKKVHLQGGIFPTNDPQRKEWKGYNSYYMGRLIGKGSVTTSGVGDEFICTNFCFTLHLEDAEDSWELLTLKDGYSGERQLLDYCYTQYTRHLLKEAAAASKALDIINTENKVNEMLSGVGNQTRTKTTGKTGTVKPKDTGAKKIKTNTDTQEGDYKSEGARSKGQGTLLFMMQKQGGSDLGTLMPTGKDWLFAANLDNAWVVRNETNPDALYGMARTIWTAMRVIGETDLITEDVIEKLLQLAGKEMNRDEDI